MENSLIHVLIVWSKANEHYEYILNDLSISFKVLNVFELTWKKDFFHENLKRFYAHSQKDKNPIEFDTIISNKIEHCGEDPFKVILFEDTNPKFENRNTSSGANNVNINVFDKKTEYRKLTGGGHKIHASDNYFESNKDISLLFNTTLKKFKNEFKQSLIILQRSNNILGVPYWKSIEELFFVLNNSIEYVVLRNFECLPDSYHVDGHGDIDILVDNYNYVKYLTGAQTVFPELKYRVYHYIDINNEKVPFDFRFFGDNYYDKKWEFNILKMRKFVEGNFFVPNDENYFYSLLYHAFIHKKRISNDYKLRLQNIGVKLGIDFKVDYSLNSIANLLNKYLESKGYSYSLPNDQTVYFNKRNAELDKIKGNTIGQGKLVASSTARTVKESFFTEVYESEDSFIKIASHPVSFNENRFLRLLEEFSFFPKILSFKNFGEYDRAIIEKINGVTFLEANNISPFWTIKQARLFIGGLLDILIILNQKGIIHRDIRPNNILIVKNNFFRPVLIDFGWSISCDDDNVITPLGLGERFKAPDGFSDTYSIALCIKEYFGKFEFANKTINSLVYIAMKNKSNKDFVFEIKRVKENLNSINDLTINDRKKMLFKRFKAIIGMKNVNKLMRFLKKIKNYKFLI